MIKRIYVDNFKCLVNFEYRPGSFQLLYGKNGSGKSTVVEVLERLRNFLWLATPTKDTFPTAHLTAWDSRPLQTFEIEIAADDAVYSYVLTIAHNAKENKSWVTKEDLRYDGGSLYHFDGHDAHLFGDDHSEGPVYPIDSSRSGIAVIPARDNNQKLTWFRQRMSQIFCFSIDPVRMSSLTDKEEALPDRGLTNFASWYRSLTQSSPETVTSLFKTLGDVIPGFKGLTLHPPAVDPKTLMARFERVSKDANGPSEYYLNIQNLSDGQRCLIALYTILSFLHGSDLTICLDEPDNFIALRELQPWLYEFRERILDMKGQCLLISHHPEFINELAVDQGVLFSRSDDGPVRIKTVDWSTAEGVSPAEIVARAWEA